MRLKGYDYSSDNLYFVTSCVQNRVCCFGDIEIPGCDLSTYSFNPKMTLNEYGEIAKKQWYWLAEQYRYVVLHSFVVMPNHIHGIIEIDRSRIISTGPFKIKPLSELIGAYKTTVSKQIHLLGFIEFQWQRSFHEHIIRDEKSFETIIEYIIHNPLNWDDEFNN
ncbi:MAG: transposase [Bacteroidales bacterium]|nr:transposase [Bacteroidales bacterium]